MVVVILDGMRYTGTVIQEGGRFYITMTEQYLTVKGWGEPEEWQVEEEYFSRESAYRQVCEQAMNAYHSGRE